MKEALLLTHFYHISGKGRVYQADSGSGHFSLHLHTLMPLLKSGQVLSCWVVLQSPLGVLQLTGSQLQFLLTAGTPNQ